LFTTLAVWRGKKEGQPRIALEREKESAFILKADLNLHLTHYQLAIDWNGVEQLVDDPYQYHGIYAEYDDLHTPKTMYQHMGSQFMTLERDGKSISGIRFLVYAPHATAVSLVGCFNDWDGRRHPMSNTRLLLPSRTITPATSGKTTNGKLAQ